MNTTFDFTGEPLETLNRDALAQVLAAETAPLSLDYRTNPRAAADDGRLARWLLVAGSLIGAAALFTAYLFYLLLVTTQGGLALLAISLAVVGAAAWRYVRGHSDARQAAFILSTGLLAPIVLGGLALAMASQGGRWTLFTAALLTTAVLADRVANHAAHWMLANPRLPQNARDRWRRTWRRRWLSPAPFATGVLLGLYGFFATADGPEQPVLLLFAAPLVAVVLALPLSMGGPVTALPRVLRLALVSWSTYGRLGTDAPGTFQSPSGATRRRQALLLVTTAAVGFALPLIVAQASPRAMNTFFPNTWEELSEMLNYVPLITTALVGGALLFPASVLSAFFLVGPAPRLLKLYGAVEAPDAPSQIRPNQATLWDCHVGRLQTSPSAVERDHLWIGTHREGDFPLLLHRPILAEHAYIFGDSGSGKTSLGLAPLLSQLLRDGESGMVVIDLKGDPALFATVREEAGDRLRYFTNELGRSSHVFNPFQQRFLDKLTHNQLCEILLESLHLNHGEGYGRSYYSRVARSALSDALRANPEAGSFRELFDTLDELLRRAPADKRRDAFELLAVVESLSTVEALNATPNGDAADPALAENAIFMREVIGKGQVAYFWLPAALESSTVREVAKLALYSLLTSAVTQAREGEGDRRQVYLVIDEFQRVASDNFRIFLEQARSMGIGVVLSNQTLADLETASSDLRKTVLTNTRFKQCFSAVDLDQQDYLITASGELIAHSKAWSERYDDEGTLRAETLSLTERVRARLDRNAIIAVSDDPTGSVVHVSRGSGLTQFGGFSMPCRSEWSLTRTEYERRQRATWPEKSDSTVQISRPETPVEEILSEAMRLRAAGIIPDGAEYADTDPGPGPVPDGPLRERLDRFAADHPDLRARSSDTSEGDS